MALLANNGWMMEPDSLYDISLAAACLAAPKYYYGLPPALKKRVLDKLTNRGLCEDVHLLPLMHISLSEVDLRDCYVTDVGISALKSVAQLTSLYMPKPPSVARALISEAAILQAVCHKPHLRILGMDKLHGVTDRVIATLCGSCTFLEELYLAGTNITDYSLSLLGNISSLSVLSLNSTQVSDAGVECLVKGTPGHTLIELCLAHCPRLTNRTVHHLCRHAKKLKTLRFHNRRANILSAPEDPDNLHEATDPEVIQEISNSFGICKLRNLTWTIY